MSNDQNKMTIEYYDRFAAGWARERDTAGYASDALQRFHELLGKGKVLEIGCGSGRDAVELTAMGYDYVGTDPARGMIEQAKERLPHGTFFNQGALELDFPENSFDGFWSFAVFVHIPPEDVDAALQRIRSCMKNGAIGFLCVKEGVGEEWKEYAEIGEGFKSYFYYYDQQSFKEILERNGLCVMESARRPISERSTWLYFYVRVEK